MKKVFLLSKYDISDTCVYLASILKHFGKNIIVIDETEEAYIKFFVNAEEEPHEVFEYQGINYIFSKSAMDEFKDADIALINTNKRMMLPMIENEDEVFVFVNQDRRELVETKLFLEALAVSGYKNVTRITNLVDSKIELEYISNFLDVDNINVIEDHEIYFDESNIKAKVENAFNLRVKFKEISNDYKNVLQEMGNVILGPEVDDKKVMKQYKIAFKLAERGGKGAGLFSK